MKTEQPKTIDEIFARDIIEGLQASPKRLSSKYFYNAKGDQLFQQIMGLEEYYLTRCEQEIFEEQKEKILDLFSEGAAFQLVELGAGDGTKTKVLLKHFLREGARFEYYPIDISGHVLQLLTDDLKASFPALIVKPLQGDYFDALAKKSKEADCRKVVMFLGSNIGNFSKPDAEQFVHKIGERLVENDLLFIGIDLKKEPEAILKAYNDSKGVTREFNMNLLRRINEELEADFDTDKFRHYPVYDPQSGECRSYLLSKEKQTVHLKALDKTIEFEAWESIHTEVSNKYDKAEIAALAEKCGFEVLENLYDSKGYFVDSVWRKK